MEMLRTAFSSAFNKIIKSQKAMEDPVTKCEAYESLQEWEVKEKEVGEEFAETLSKFVNIMNGDERQVYAILKMANQHRTLQQNMTRFCVGWLEHLAVLSKDSDRYSDLRNEDSMKLAKEFVEKMESSRYLRNV